MSDSQTIDDKDIIQTIEALQADGENITSWAVQSRLNGGDFSRIEQIIEQQLTKVSETKDSTEQSSSKAMAKKQQNQDILEQEMPSNIASSMSAMQQALGQMANQIWSDAAGTAENKVREKLSNLQQAYDETKIAYTNAQKTNEQMQQTINTLNHDLQSLQVEYQQSVENLAENEAILKSTAAAKDDLEKSVEALEVDNQQLEQTAFDAKLESAKTQGLAETIQEQLYLAKESEKQLKRSLERAENKIDELNIELHNTNKALREESLERQALEKALKEQAQQEQLAKPVPTNTQDNKQDSSIEPPQVDSNQLPEEAPATDSNTIAEPKLEQSAEQPQPQQDTIKEAEQQSIQPSVQQTKQPAEQPIQQTIQRIKPSTDKTRSLSAKLFERKREQPKLRRK